MTINTISPDEKDQVKINGLIKRIIELLNGISDFTITLLALTTAAAWRTALGVVAATPGQVVGTNTNDDATAGNVGEYVSSEITSGFAVTLTNGTSANVTSISLTAGDWDVTITGYFNPDGGTTTTVGVMSISTVSATLSAAPISRIGLIAMPSAGYLGAGSGGNLTVIAGPTRVSLASTTTVYFVALGSFSGGALRAYGHLRARRMR